MIRVYCNVSDEKAAQMFLKYFRRFGRAFSADRLLALFTLGLFGRVIVKQAKEIEELKKKGE